MMYASTRCLAFTDPRAPMKLVDQLSPVLNRSGWAFDHVAIDVTSIAASLAHLTRDAVGHQRDTEMVKLVHRQLTNVLLRRIQPKKSIALLMDGSNPLWMVEQMRLFPGKRYDSRFYRSVASPMVYLLEEKLLSIPMDLRTPPPPPEAIFSGPATPGPVEGKVTSWLLDLATRTLRPPTNPLHLAPPITANDSVCLIGKPDLLLNMMAVTPFHNITTVTLQKGELKSLSLQEAMDWLSMGELLRSPQSTTTNTDTALQQRLAAARTDLVFLYLLTEGLPSTGLPQVLSCDFRELVDVYTTCVAELDVTSNGIAEAACSFPRFKSYLFDEIPVSAETLDQSSLRLKPVALQRLLVQFLKRTIGAGAANPGPRISSHATILLEMALQSHGLVCSGSIPSMSWTPTPVPVSSSGTAAGAATALMDKFPKLSLDQLISHLAHLTQQQHSATAPSGNPVGSGSYLAAQRRRNFALTGVESLLLSATQPELINSILPLYARGHTLPAEVATDIVQTRNIHDALVKVRHVLHDVLQEAQAAAAAGAAVVSTNNSSGDAVSAGGPHPALTHLPTYFFTRTPGSRGPPPGWNYYSIHLGIKAEAMNIRYSINASDTATLRIIENTGLSKRNMLYVCNSDADVEGGRSSWVEVSCDHLEQNPGDGGGSLRIVTWNTQFSRHSGEQTPLGREGIDWCSATRYVALSKILEETDADVICLQEAEPAWAAFLATQPWVRQSYAMTCTEHSHVLQPWGVLMLVRRDRLTVAAVQHANIPAFTGHTSAMPEITVQVGNDVAPIVIGGLHLLAPYNQNSENNRVTQLKNLEKHLQTNAWNNAAELILAAESGNAGRSASHIVVGDFNDYPAKYFRLNPELGYKDAWEQLNPNCHSPSATAAERGYTIDGAASPYTAKIIEPEFFGRPDRVLFSSKQLQPISAELVGTKSVIQVLGSTAVGGEALKQIDNPSIDIPDYLYPSDHFGVCIEFQVM